LKIKQAKLFRNDIFINTYKIVKLKYKNKILLPAMKNNYLLVYSRCILIKFISRQNYIWFWKGKIDKNIFNHNIKMYA